MSYILAVAGKGGTGKTTIAALLINWLNKNKKGSVLAVDADPNSTLAEALGVKAKESIGQIVESISQNPSQVPGGMSKDHYIEYRLQETLSENKGFDLLVMGRPEGPGCYCYVNNVLRGVVKKFADNYEYVVIDNEAGMEHLSRRTMRKADCMVLVADCSAAGLRSVKRIYNLAKDLDIKTGKFVLAVNRVQNKDCLKNEIKEIGIEQAFCIPEDQKILEFSNQAIPLNKLNSDSVALKEINKLGEELWH
ncbi:MAG: AAA family ATPase [Candidatus Omnitrophota bacterium]|nr:AAA family ATPase [Candidatus Omnitrophota bacterium]